MPGAIRTLASLAVLAVGFLSAPDAPAAQPIEVDAEIVLAVDASGSVDSEEREIQRQGYALALRHPDLMRVVTAGRHGRIVLSYFEWGGDVRPAALIPWRLIDGPAAAASLAGEIEGLVQPASRGTSISRAIDFAVALLAGSGFAPAKRIIDVSGDGPNNVGPPVTLARDRAIAQGITVNGLPILVRPSRGYVELDRYFEDCVIGGDGAFALPVRDPAELAFAIRRKLILEVSGAALERVRPVSQAQTTDCMIGEGMRRSWIRRFEDPGP